MEELQPGIQSFGQHRLERLGLSYSLIRDCVAQGFDAYRRTLSLSSRMQPGTNMWNETVRAISIATIGLRWTRSDESNLPRVVAPDGSIQVIVATGDGATGRLERFPETKNPKGPIVLRLIDLQHKQLPFPHLVTTPVSEVPPELWVLLFHRDNQESTVRFEVSRPTSVYGNGPRKRINGWSDRQFLGEIAFDEISNAVRSRALNEETIDFLDNLPPDSELEVKWKHNG